MTPGELIWLATAADGLEFAVEFGSWCGRSSVALSTARRVLCVDSWAGSAEHEAIIREGFDPWESWRLNTSSVRHVKPLRVNLRDETAVEAMVSQYRRAADLVFVDASHDYESVASDISVAKTLLRPSGTLCGHDYRDDGVWPGVKRAVDEVVGAVEVCESIWFRKLG